MSSVSERMGRSETANACADNDDVETERGHRAHLEVAELSLREYV